MVHRKRNSALFKVILLCFSGLLLTGNLFAHGNEKHVMGTVKSISGDSIVVEETSHQTVTVQLTRETKFTKAGQASSKSELKSGDRVVVHAMASGGRLEATEVKFGAASTPSVKKGKK